MIKEFALEPDALVASAQDFKYLIEKFGVSQGRVISRFPKRWDRMVYEAANRNLCGTVELSRIEIRLRQMIGNIVIDSRRDGGDGTKPWLERALAEHAGSRFAAIIATKNPTNQPSVLVSSELDESVELFQAQSNWRIERTAQSMFASVELLLHASKTVKLIDPHFDPSKPRWKRMLSLVIAKLGSKQMAGAKLEIHRADDGVLPKNMCSRFEPTIPDMKPSGVSVEIFLHKPETMHNRFVLTEIGGVSFNTGLDDNEECRAGSTTHDVVCLLEQDVYLTEYAAYSGHQPYRTYS
jgi:hypothetical protein